MSDAYYAFSGKLSRCFGESKSPLLHNQQYRKEDSGFPKVSFTSWKMCFPVGCQGCLQVRKCQQETVPSSGRDGFCFHFAERLLGQ